MKILILGIPAPIIPLISAQPEHYRTAGYEAFSLSSETTLVQHQECAAEKPLSHNDEISPSISRSSSYHLSVKHTKPLYPPFVCVQYEINVIPERI